MQLRRRSHDVQNVTKGAKRTRLCPLRGRRAWLLGARSQASFCLVYTIRRGNYAGEHSTTPRENGEDESPKHQRRSKIPEAIPQVRNAHLNKGSQKKFLHILSLRFVYRTPFRRAEQMCLACLGRDLGKTLYHQNDTDEDEAQKVKGDTEPRQRVSVYVRRLRSYRGLAWRLESLAAGGSGCSGRGRRLRCGGYRRACDRREDIRVVAKVGKGSFRRVRG